MKTLFLSVIFFWVSSGFIFAESKDVTATKTVKNFFKANTDLKIAQDASEDYKQALNALSLKVIKRASELARLEDKKTVLARHLKQASDEVFRRSPMTISELMEKIKLLSIIDLAELTKQVQVYGQELMQQRSE